MKGQCDLLCRDYCIHEQKGMKMYTTELTGVKNWASILEDNTARQAEMLSRCPVVWGDVALMPDAHLGKGATVGSVIATKDAIIPAAVGVDIGCGIIATRTGLKRQNLPTNLSELHNIIAETVPSGVGRRREEPTLKAAAWMNNNRYLDEVFNVFTDSRDRAAAYERASLQLGTLGSGNHFLEVSVDEDDWVWMVIHSGSRGIGNKLATIYVDIAKAEMQQKGINLEDKDLSYLVSGTESFQEYMKVVFWGQEYAYMNREIMMDGALAALGKVTIVRPYVKETINCHHNFTSIETHFDETLYITRKGAIRAGPGELGIIPGSMATATYIVRGLGNPDSFNSSPHGAGRTHSRGAAKRAFNIDSLREWMGDRAWNDYKPKQLLDEHPEAYKDIEQVMADSADLVESVVKLTSILNYKGV